jgi:hypothetical protein
MWMDNARLDDYDRVEAEHIYHIASSRGRTLPEGSTIDSIRRSLYQEDYDACVRNSVGAYDAGAPSRLETYKKVIGMVTPLHAVQIALFGFIQNPWDIDVEELQWIVYLYHANYSMVQVLTMTKQEHVVLYTDSAEQGGLGWPSIRKTIQHGEDEIPLDQIDVGYRSLRALRDL